MAGIACTRHRLLPRHEVGAGSSGTMPTPLVALEARYPRRKARLGRVGCCAGPARVDRQARSPLTTAAKGRPSYEGRGGAGAGSPEPRRRAPAALQGLVLGTRTATGAASVDGAPGPGTGIFFAFRTGQMHLACHDTASKGWHHALFLLPFAFPSPFLFFFLPYTISFTDAPPRVPDPMVTGPPWLFPPRHPASNPYFSFPGSSGRKDVLGAIGSRQWHRHTGTIPRADLPAFSTPACQKYPRRGWIRVEHLSEDCRLPWRHHQSGGQ